MSVLLAATSLLEELANSDHLIKRGGRIVAIAPNVITVTGLSRLVSLGDLVTIADHGAGEIIRCEGELVFVSPFHSARSICVGDLVYVDKSTHSKPSLDWLGRVLDAIGNPIDGRGPIGNCRDSDMRRVNEDSAPLVLQRDRVERPLKTGVRIIDIFTPMCRGQRMGIFAGSGVGKSTLLAMLARSLDFDVVVVAMVGERGREVREFVEDALGPQTLEKSVVIVSTSDESPMLRKRAPELAMETCEFFSRAGNSVLLLMDSVTRYAHALREIGVANGEPPVARGYPSSVFSQLPRLLERAGPGSGGAGSITAVVTVLVDGDDHNDPVSDSVRGIIDGHLVLDRSIAEEARYPPIDPLSSISRLSSKVWSTEEADLVAQLRKMIAQFEGSKDIRMLGGWVPGTDPVLDKAVETVPVIYDALCQSPAEPPSQEAFSELVAHLKGGQNEGQPDAVEPV